MILLICSFVITTMKLYSFSTINLTRNTALELQLNHIFSQKKTDKLENRQRGDARFIIIFYYVMTIIMLLYE